MASVRNDPLRLLGLTIFVRVLPLLLLCSPLGGCKGKRNTPARAKPDARAQATHADAAASPIRARRPGAMTELLGHIPRRAQWFLALGNPAGLTHGAARLWRLLSVVPALEQPFSAATKAFAGVGRWPPDPALWQRLGIDGDGGIVVASLAGEAGRPSTILVVALARQPEQLLRILAPKRPRNAPPKLLSRLRATVSDGSEWWCGRRASAVLCASNKELAARVRRSGGAPSSVVTLLPASSLTSADIVGGLHDTPAKKPSLLSVRFTPLGLRARLQLRGPYGQWIRGWLGAGRAALRLPPNVTAALRLQLSATRLQTLLAVLPRNRLRLSTPGGSVDLKRLAQQCTGDVLFSIGPQGWSVVARRSGASKAVAVPVRFRAGPGLVLWVLAPARRLVIGSTAAAVQGAAATSPHPAPAVFRQLFSRPTPAALLIPLVDPLEVLPAASRAQLVAALAGLPAGERAFVGLFRALLTLMGETGVTVERITDGVELLLELASPVAGPRAARRAFTQAWRSKWRGGGFFDRAGLQRIRSAHPATTVGRLVGLLSRTRLSARLGQWVSGRLVRLLAWLRGPELSCSALAARLTRCREAFGRQLAPARWREVDAAVLGPYRKRRKSELLDRAQRNARALGNRCDQVSGRLENATQLQRCLSLTTCRKFAACLQRAFVAKTLRKTP